MWSTLIVFAALVIYWVVCKIKRGHVEKCAENIPGDNGYPIVGNLLSYINTKFYNDTLRVFFGTGRKYVDYGIWKSWAGNVLIVGVTNPKYIEIIANSPYSSTKDPFAAAVLHGFPKGAFSTVDVESWKVLRKALIKSLTKNHIENDFQKIFVRKNKQFVNYMKEKRSGKEVDVIKELQNLAIDISSETLLGVKTNEVEDPKFNFVDHVTTFVQNSYILGALLALNKRLEFLQPLTRNGKLRQAKKDLNKFMTWIFQERMKDDRTTGNLPYYPDYLLKRKLEKNLSMYDIERELVDIVFAGSDTSSVIASSVLLFLAMFPEIQEEAYQEQLSIFGENTKLEPTPEDLASMVYLTRVVKETIRFTSPPVVLKRATGDIELDKYTIPKGTVIIVAIDLVCFDERYWEKPKEFYPDHFLPEKEAERPTYAYPVFGIGPRSCPGVQYGMASIRTIVSLILRNFRLSTNIKFEDLNVEYNLMRKFESYMIKLEERKPAIL